MKKLIAAIALMSSLAAHAEFQDAVQAYYAGDYDTAMKEYRTLADQGDPRGEFGVGYMHHYGHGVKRDDAEALKWFQRAVDRNDVKARQYMGIIYQAGEGVPKDVVAAHMWHSLFARDAPDRDRAYTMDTVRKMERKMTPEQIAQAKKMAAEWKPAKQ